MPENQNIEWKSKWRDDYLEWICGFANAQGGTIYIGIDDDGHVTGLTNTKKLLEDIPNKVRNAMGIVVDVDLLSEDGNEYIKITIPPYPVAVSCKGVYYYRSGSTLQTLSGPCLLYTSGPRSFDTKAKLKFLLEIFTVLNTPANPHAHSGKNRTRRRKTN